MNAAQTFANNLGQTMTKMTMTDFFNEIHSQFYPDQDISFMEYFLELTNHENEFVVHHEKLVEYGIMTSNESSKVNKRLARLMLIENEDYQVADVGEPVKQGGYSTKKVYHLTPGAFKICLMRAQRRVNQPIDPVIYCNYYLLLEKIYKLYTDYERTYSEKLLSMKDDKIDKLQKTVEDQSAEIRAQSAEIRELLGYAKDTNKTSCQCCEFTSCAEINSLDEKSYQSRLASQLCNSSKEESRNKCDDIVIDCWSKLIREN